MGKALGLSEPPRVALWNWGRAAELSRAHMLRRRAGSGERYGSAALVSRILSAPRGECLPGADLPEPSGSGALPLLQRIRKVLFWRRFWGPVG